MDNSIYVALSNQLAVFRDMAVTANNIANSDTPGYHAEHVMFTDYLVNEGNRQSKLAFTQDIASWRDTTNGTLQLTGGKFDLGIQGPGFFVVETAAGPRYTRAGNFNLNNNGELVTSAGNPVLGQGGIRIVFDATDKNIRIGENGVVSSQTPFGQIEERGQLEVVEFEDPQDLKRMNNQLYETEQQAVPAIESRVVQGVLEQSNVSGVSELVKVTKLSRSTASTAKFIEVMYDLQRKTSNAYARPDQG